MKTKEIAISLIKELLENDLSNDHKARQIYDVVETIIKTERMSILSIKTDTEDQEDICPKCKTIVPKWEAEMHEKHNSKICSL